MYSTCLGLILKGYSDYEHKYKEFNDKFSKVEVPKNLIKDKSDTKENLEIEKVVEVVGKKKSGKFWAMFKNNLIELFKEEEDKIIS